ncbi:DUF5908 family protein [Glaciecola sp. 1036]|uniref:DUF5908 family protein n=1 Tax=Alteromonadaceae TaxID=72275 RepID=UPI003D04DC79
MPLIIDEVVISINVDNRGSPRSTARSGQNPQAKKEIVEECVEQVMEILRQQQEP